LGKFLGNGLLTSDGDFHRQQRALVQPAFHTGRIQAYGRVMVDYTEHMMTTWEDGQIRDSDQDMMRLTMFIVSKTLFDADVSEEAERVGLAIQDLQEISNAEYRRAFPMPDWIPTTNNRRRRRAIAIIDETIKRIITDRRSTAKNGMIEDTGDLLSMLLLAQDEEGGHMSDRQVRDEAVTLFAAGHETTSNTLTWTWYLLSQHPEAEARLHAELNAVLGGRPPTIEDLQNLPYTQMVLKESMRLYPPAWILNGRTATEDVIVGGYQIPTGSVAYVSPYLMHRLPDYFPEPERFDPSRFAPELEATIPRYAYIPFGGGPRVCIGNAFAMMEAQLILSTSAQRCRLSLTPGQEVIPSPQITMSVKDRLKMQLLAH
jgi:cytochrome P450